MTRFVGDESNWHCCSLLSQANLISIPRRSLSAFKSNASKLAARNFEEVALVSIEQSGGGGGGGTIGILFDARFRAPIASQRQTLVSSI